MATRKKKDENEEREKEGGQTRPAKGGQTRKGDGPRVEKLAGHGHRTLAMIGADELAQEARAEAEAEDFSRSEARPSAAGPDPYNLSKAKDRTPLEEAEATSEAADAEISTIGSDPLTDTGAKIRLHPDRLGADDKVELPRAKTPHEEATAEAEKEALSAEKNVGALPFGGGKHE